MLPRFIKWMCMRCYREDEVGEVTILRRIAREEEGDPNAWVCQQCVHYEIHGGRPSVDPFSLTDHDVFKSFAYSMVLQDFEIEQTRHLLPAGAYRSGVDPKFKVYKRICSERDPSTLTLKTMPQTWRDRGTKSRPDDPDAISTHLR